MGKGAPRLVLQGVRRGFDQGGVHLDVLSGVDLQVGAGEMVALVGPSGSGKSTLLHTAGLLERPNAGTVAIEGKPCNDLGDGDRTALRRSAIGFVYQFHHLLPDFSAVENVILPQMIAGKSRKAARTHAEELLARVGLATADEDDPLGLAPSVRLHGSLYESLRTNLPRDRYDAASPSKSTPAPPR